MSANKKQLARQRRAKKCRMNIRQQRKIRLSVHRTAKHIYAQIFSADGATVLASAGTTEKAVREHLGSTGNVAAAEHVGKLLAERAVQAGVSDVAFDRSGLRYHGRVKALAEAARAGGIQF